MTRRPNLHTDESARQAFRSVMADYERRFKEGDRDALLEYVVVSHQLGEPMAEWAHAELAPAFAALLADSEFNLRKALLGDRRGRHARSSTARHDHRSHQAIIEAVRIAEERGIQGEAVYAAAARLVTACGQAINPDTLKAIWFQEKQRGPLSHDAAISATLIAGLCKKLPADPDFFPPPSGR